MTKQELKKQIEDLYNDDITGCSVLEELKAMEECGVTIFWNNIDVNILGEKF